MPLIALSRALLGFVSLVLLAAAVWLLWSWWEGRLVADAVGTLYRERDDWRLWTGGALLAWSCLGRWPVLWMLARPDTDPTRPRREPGAFVEGAKGSHLYVESRGATEGMPLVLTHGWGLDSTIWDYVSRDLGRNHRLVVWDLPGLGRSSAGPGEISLPMFAVGLRRVVESVTAGPVILVGHSIGGMTIQTLARDHPEFMRDQVAGVILLNTTDTNPLRTMILSPVLTALQKPVIEPLMRLTVWLAPLARVAAWQGYLSGSAHVANRLGFGRQVTRSQLDHTTLLATRNSPAVQARGNRAMFHWDAEAAFADLETPLLVLGGRADIVTRPDAGRRIAASAPQGRYQEIDDVNHMGFLERADLYHAAIAAFAAEVAAADLATALQSPCGIPSTDPETKPAS